MIASTNVHAMSLQAVGLRRPFISLALSLGTVFCLFLAPLRASDGAIEINQVRAEVGGVTPGDLPGFPVTLTEPGSYRLTSNLDVRNTANPMDTTAIEVFTAGVSIDLGGFAIRGPVVCTASGGPTVPTTLVCTPTGGSGHGVTSDTRWSTRVANGTVMGMGSNGIDGAGEVRSVVAISNGDHGIVSELIVDSTGSRNDNQGLKGTVVSNSIANENGELGIRGGVVVGSSAVSNSGTGIDALAIHHSQATFNGGGGFFADLVVGSGAHYNSQHNVAGGYSLSHFEGNDGGQTQVLGLDLGANVCSGSTNCP